MPLSLLWTHSNRSGGHGDPQSTSAEKRQTRGQWWRRGGRPTGAAGARIAKEEGGDKRTHATARLRHRGFSKNCGSESQDFSSACSDEGSHCKDSQARRTPAYPFSTGGKSVRTHSHSSGASIAWEDKATSLKRVKQGNTESASKAVVLRQTTHWGSECPTCGGSERPRAEPTGEQIQLLEGCALAEPTWAPSQSQKVLLLLSIS